MQSQQRKTDSANSGTRGATYPAATPPQSSGTNNFNSTNHNASSTRNATAKNLPPGADTVGTSMKFDVCIEALMGGCVNSFVNVFTLSHRDPVCVDELAQTMFSIPDERLPWVLERFSSAEQKRRRADYKGVLEDYLALSQYFEAHGDRAQAIRQHQLALQVCTESLDRLLEGQAHESIAKLYERFGMLHEAMLHHETRSKLADLSNDPEMKLVACRNLVRVCMLRGEQCVKDGQYDDSTTYYTKAVTIARQAGDQASEAKAYNALGDVTILIGDMKKALDYQQRFLICAKSTADGHAESTAAINVGKLQHNLGQEDAAIQSLKEALHVAEENNDLPSLNEACRQLGETYKAQGQNTLAVHYFRQHFAVACDMGDPELVDSSRIMLGFAVGDHHFEHAGQRRGFLSVVGGDLHTLLDWLGNGVL